MNSPTLVTLAPPRTHSEAYLRWQDAILALARCTRLYIWHEGPASDWDPAVAASLPNIVSRQKSELWHRDRVDALLTDGDPLENWRLLSALQAVGLLNDAVLTHPEPSTRYLWLNPGLLAELGSEAPRYFADLAWLDQQQYAFFYLQPRRNYAETREIPEITCTELMLVNAASMQRVNAIYWHLYGENLQQNRLPDLREVFESISDGLEGDTRWFALDQGGLPAQFFASLATRDLTLYRNTQLFDV